MDEVGWSWKVMEMGWGTDKDEKGKKGGHTMTQVCEAEWNPALSSEAGTNGFTPKQDVAIHMCCTTKVTLHKIQDCSTVVRCTRAGCETVWVCNPL